MTSIALYTFSGTGNTFLLAEMLKEAFEQQGCTVDALRIEELHKSGKTPDMRTYDWVGIGAPVLGFTTPYIVYDFIKSLPEGKGQKVFIFRTAGGVQEINYNASKSLIRRLERKGYIVTYERILAFSSNWAEKFDTQVILRLIDATREKVPAMCAEILAGKERRYSVGIVQRVLLDILSPLVRLGFRQFGKDYTVNDDCIHCGLCIENCPVDNIHEVDGKIKFKSNCMSCMRCIYACPTDAIHFRLFKFTVVKGGYDLSKILATPKLEGTLEGVKKPGFYEEYVRNLDF
ncbi:MAG: EFR1 family ferrodoxin [Anaerolineae bacterium]|jgi:ferredoxin|nr:EFR1 family ferrodoxin [Anaerolineae bacterium]